MHILGINAYHPDSSAAIISDGKLIATCEEERFCRIKHFVGFPEKSIRYCLKEANISIKDVDYIAIPRKKCTRILKKAFYGLKMPALAKHRLTAWGKITNTKSELSCALDISEDKIRAKIVPVEHHRAHLASSFFTSGFDKAFVFSMDALGDFASTMWAIGEGVRLKPLGEIAFPHSLGFYYTAITQYLGFLHFGDEYKVMGLAPYGEWSYKDEFEKILRLNKKGFKLGLDYFFHHRYSRCLCLWEGGRGNPDVDFIFSPYLEKRLGKKRNPGQPIEKKHKDIAFSLQKRLEEAILHLLKSHAPKNMTNLCLSGGVAHNCVANGKILENMHFKNIYVPPAPGDAGLAIGASFYLWNHTLKNLRNFHMKHAYWGPGATDDTLKTVIASQKQRLDKENCQITKVDSEVTLCQKVAQQIADGKIVGWFQGRMEFGPRALGNRSILADPRKKDIKDILNTRIKHREPFRPFAPSVLQEDVSEYFSQTHPSPFMSFVYNIKDDKKELIPAVCHINTTARLQTVDRESNPLYWRLINKFKAITGVGMLLNTSFNENEPIICLPDEAIDCFLRTKMDVLVLGSYIIER